MTFYYYVYHKLCKDGGVTLAFKNKQSQIRVKDKACREGHFSFEEYRHLRAKRVKLKTRLSDFNK